MFEVYLTGKVHTPLCLIIYLKYSRMLRTALENWWKVELYEKKKINSVREELTQLVQKTTDKIEKKKS